MAAAADHVAAAPGCSGFAALRDLQLRPGAQTRAERHYTGSDHFGMVTNYQVVSEIATRAVGRFNSTLTNIITTNTFYALEGSSSNYVQMIVGQFSV